MPFIGLLATQQCVVMLADEGSSGVINFIDRALERYLREEVPLRESNIGLAFDPPDRDWGAALNRPTVNVFMWDVARAERAGSSGLDERRVEDGVERRRASVRVELRYLITAWATEVADEHRLLGDVLRTILAKRELPGDVIPEGLVEGACRVFVESEDQRQRGDFWSALGGKYKPAIRVMVSALIPVDEWKLAAPAPSSIDLGVQPALAQPALAAVPAARWVPTEEGVPTGDETPATNGTPAANAGGNRRLRRNGVVSSEGRGSAPSTGSSQSQDRGA